MLPVCVRRVWLLFTIDNMEIHSVCVQRYILQMEVKRE